jgi:hypothetical protein
MNHLFSSAFAALQMTLAINLSLRPHLIFSSCNLGQPNRYQYQEILDTIDFLQDTFLQQEPSWWGHEDRQPQFDHLLVRQAMPRLAIE